MAASSTGDATSSDNNLKDDDNPTSAAAAATPTERAGIYHCHVCNRRVDHITEEFTCPSCGQGFLEKVEDGGEAGGGGDSFSYSDDEPGHEDEHHDSAHAHAHNHPMEVNDIMRNLLTGIMGSVGGSGTTGGASGGRAQNNQPPMLQMFLEQLVNNLNADVHVQVNGPSGSHRVFHIPGMQQMHGNMGDYAWGPGGLDQIVTQLLNQFEGGAPSLSKAKINQLPTVSVTEKQCENKMQCTTCMEEFTLGENVRKLPCGHLFHTDCIVPWLERHGTCPICRKLVDPTATDPSASSGGGQNYSDRGNGGAGGSGSGGGSHQRQQQPRSMVDTIDDLD